MIDWDYVIGNPLMRHEGVERDVNKRFGKREDKSKRQNPLKVEKKRGY